MEALLQLWRPPSLSFSFSSAAASPPASRPPSRASQFPIALSSPPSPWWHSSAQRLILPPTCCCCATRGPGPAPKGVTPPPREYDFRAATSAQTRMTVQRLHPELMDLVEDGTLVIVQRPLDYVERRGDGYVEPEVVYLVGTAHLSKLSAVQVTRVINSVRPDNVVVELCRSRAGIMYDEAPTSSDVKQAGNPNLMSMSGDSFGSAVGRSLKLECLAHVVIAGDVGGRSALALRLLLAAVSNRLSTSAGVATGEEFRAARKAAEVVGAQIVLGDRPIEITLQRAWKSLRWDERFRFAVVVLQSTTDKNLDVSEESLEALKSDDALSAMFGELSSRFPSLLQPLIHERDMYLAWSLKRSKAVNGCKRVVGVVGKGHLRGVVHALLHDQANLRFRDLVGARPSAPGSSPPWALQLRKLATNLAIETALGFLLWWAWTSFQPH